MTKQQMIDQLQAAHDGLSKTIYEAQADHIDLDYVDMHLKQISDVIAVLQKEQVSSR